MKADIEKLFLDSLINSLPDNIYFKDTDSRFLLVNRALSQRFGLDDPAKALGRTDFDFFDADHARQARDDELRVMTTGNPIIAKEERETNREGQTKWVLSTKLPLYDTDGKMIGTFGVSRDVTEIKTAQQALLESEAELRRHQEQLEEEVRKRTEELSQANIQMQKEVQERRQAEQSLRVSEERYRRLLQVNPTYIYTVTIKKGRPVKTQHGPGCQVVTGYSPQEYLDNPNLWIVMVHPEDRELVKKFVTEDLTQRNHQNQIEHRIINKDGRVHWVRNTVVHHYDDEGELVRYDGLVEDITARKHADERQKENERLGALSVMANGVVNNYSQVMQQIADHASSIAAQVARDTKIHSEAQSILQHASGMSELNERLSTVAHAYSKDDADPLKSVKVKRLISKALRPLKKTFTKQDIEVNSFIPSGLQSVTVREHQLLDVLTIMLVNAAEAMPDGGDISITASSKNILRSSHRWNQIARGGKYVILRVSDTGVGMEKEVADKVFDSFFSTKKAGSFGLGLAMAQAAVKSWGGWIRLRTTPGHGTVFRIFMPVSEQQEYTAELPKPAASLRGRTALVVEDRKETAEEIAEALGREGMNVLTAHNPAEATELFSDNTDKISLCIIDMVLGSGEWQDTIEQIYELKPEANVIVTSGFSREYARSALPVGAWSFLQKPFETSSVAQLAKDIISRDNS